jgi:hypothetical protein
LGRIRSPGDDLCYLCAATGRLRERRIPPLQLPGTRRLPALPAPLLRVLATHSTQFEYLHLFDAPVDITGIEPVTVWPERIEVITAQELPGGVFNVDFRAFVDAD